MQICLVEDDPTIQEFVARTLQKKGYETQVFSSAEAVLTCDCLRADLYILDVLLEGGMTGLDLCRIVKKTNPWVPVIILSALSDSSDRIEGLKEGAEDYLTKPFEMEELLLRVEGLLKRSHWYRHMPEGGSYRWGENEINFENLEARVGRQQFSLSPKETMSMKLLIEEEGRVVTRERILDKVWGENTYPTERTVDNFILRLRKRFDKRNKYIHSIRGMGYKFDSKGTS